MGDLVPRKTLVKQGGYAIGGVGGGIAALIANAALNGHFLPSLIVGGIVGLVGLAVGSSKDDRTAGIVTTVAGVVMIAGGIPFLHGIAGFLLGVSGVGLLIVGGINLFKFIKNYRNRM